MDPSTIHMLNFPCNCHVPQVRPQHIAQAAGHFGDQYVPLLGLLLSCSVAYCAERVLKDDIPQQVSSLVITVVSFIKLMAIDASHM